MEQSQGLAYFFLDPDVMKTHNFHEFEKFAWNLRNIRPHTRRPLETTGPSRVSRYVNRRAAVSRVIRVQMRCRPNPTYETSGLSSIQADFELFIALYMICRYFSHIECTSGIYLVKIS